jgi:hypothetical protein
MSLKIAHGFSRGFSPVKRQSPVRDERSFLPSLAGLFYSPHFYPALKGWAIVEAHNFVVVNPNGIPSFSPGLRGTSYPGFTFPKSIFNPEGVASAFHHEWIQPFQGWVIFHAPPSVAPPGSGQRWAE